MADLKLTRKRIGAVTDIQTASRAIQDLASMIDSLVGVLDTEEAGPVSPAIKFFVREGDGKFHLWTLTDGAGCSLALDAATRTATVTVP